MYEFLRKAHAVATKINASWTAGAIAPMIAYGLKFNWTQYAVFLICMPVVPIGTTIERARTASQHSAKKATTYLLFL